MREYIASEGDTVDYIAWRAYESTENRIVESVLDANPGLSDIGPTLPAGTKVFLPVIDAAKTNTGTHLWN